METTATFDKDADEFIINTPTTVAQKYWITNSAVHAKWSAVFAQLLIDGKNHGIHGFLVRIRNEVRDNPNTMYCAFYNPSCASETQYQKCLNFKLRMGAEGAHCRDAWHSRCQVCAALGAYTACKFGNAGYNVLVWNHISREATPAHLFAHMSYTAT